MNLSETKPIILFDGICNLCNGAVQFIIKRDKKAVFKFAALQSEKAREILASLHTTPEEVHSAVLIDDGKMFLKSTGVIRILSRLPYWRWFKIFMFVPKFLRDFIYEVVAKYRYKIFGKMDSCMIPTPQLKARFLE
ncbi:MAG TPA: thiol-disulfide oxidoreductase DCC family protein [Chitinophagales bacterium]|nr:thiol-disulfide oxidoreductase DCC family protein [Chitinophagales bacterium]